MIVWLMFEQGCMGNIEAIPTIYAVLRVNSSFLTWEPRMQKTYTTVIVNLQ